MSRVVHRLRIVIIAVSVSGLPHEGALAYEIEQHAAMSRTAAVRSEAAHVLRDILDRGAGLDTRIGGRSLVEWIEQGARAEDDTPRYLQHFHDPLRTWDTSGLGLVPRFRSSIQWAQDAEQEWSWGRARNECVVGLSGEQPLDRDVALARTFRALGQLVHLVQDVASPAHTRNDPHVTYTYEKAIDTMHRGPDGEARLFLEGLLARSMAPDPRWSLLPPNPLAPVPIARLVDADRYVGDNPSITRADPGEGGSPTPAPIGLAEYTNANFFSEDRIFSEDDLIFRYPYPRRTSTSIRGVDITLPGGEPVRRQYYWKERDGDQGYRLATVGFFRDYQTRFSLDPLAFDRKTGLDAQVYQDYAQRLIPRAVGYSTALLDYFFRGRLQAKIELVDEVRLAMEITNASSEPMNGGVLKLFAEDRDGRRVLVTDIQREDGRSVVGGVVDIDAVAPAAPLPAIVFQPPFPTDRFAIVYTGDLGNERRDQPAGMIGAVAGKVLSGGPRAEAIVPDGDTRVLRTPEGLFPLPAPASALAGIQWGDTDNTFVGFVAVEPGSLTPADVQAFRIDRPVGSPDVPLSPDGTVTLEALKSARFPFGMSVGVAVDFAQTTRYRQILTTFETVRVTADSPSGPRLVSVESTTPTAETVVDETFPFTGQYAITLDEPHLSGGVRGWRWDVLEVGFDAQGRLLALVLVILDDPDLPSREVALVKRDADGQMHDAGTLAIHPRLPAPVSFLALVDVERAETLGTTAAPMIAIAYGNDVSAGFVQQHVVEQGPDGTTGFWQDAPAVRRPDPPDFPLVETGVVTVPPTGFNALTLAGRFREDLDPLVGNPLGVTTRTTEELTTYALDGIDQAKTYKAVRRIVPAGSLTGGETLVNSARRLRLDDGSTTEVLTLFTRPAGPTGGEHGVLVRWAPEAPAMSRRAYAADLPPRYYSLVAATREAALLTALDPSSFDSVTLFVDLGGGTVRDVASADLSAEYLLMGPGLLYSVDDTRFHVIENLQPSPLPLPLAADDPTTPFDGAYHLLHQP
jgi:hypothetical protein